MSFNERHGAAVADMYAEGMTQQEIAAHFNAATGTICRTLRIRGVEARRTGARMGVARDEKAEARLREVAVAVRGGATLSSIAQREGVKEQTLASRLGRWAWRHWLASRDGES